MESAPVFGSTSPLETASAFGITSGPNSNIPAGSVPSSLSSYSALASIAASAIDHAAPLGSTSSSSAPMTAPGPMPEPAPASAPTPTSSAGNSNESTTGSTFPQVTPHSFDRSAWCQNAATQSSNTLAPVPTWNYQIVHAYRSYEYSDELIETC